MTGFEITEVCGQWGSMESGKDQASKGCWNDNQNEHVVMVLDSLVNDDAVVEVVNEAVAKVIPILG